MAIRLRQLRTDRNLTRKDLATAANLGESTIQAIEQARHFGSPETHRRLAEALGVSITELVYGKEEEPNARSLSIPNEVTPEQYRFLEALVRFFVAENARPRPMLSTEVQHDLEAFAEERDKENDIKLASIPVIK